MISIGMKVKQQYCVFKQIRSLQTEKNMVGTVDNLCCIMRKIKEFLSVNFWLNMGSSAHFNRNWNVDHSDILQNSEEVLLGILQ